MRWKMSPRDMQKCKICFPKFVQKQSTLRIIIFFFVNIHFEKNPSTCIHRSNKSMQLQTIYNPAFQRLQCKKIIEHISIFCYQCNNFLSQVALVYKSRVCKGFQIFVILRNTINSNTINNMSIFVQYKSITCSTSAIWGFFFSGSVRVCIFAPICTYIFGDVC